MDQTPRLSKASYHGIFELASKNMIPSLVSMPSSSVRSCAFSRLDASCSPGADRSDAKVSISSMKIIEGE